MGSLENIPRESLEKLEEFIKNFQIFEIFEEILDVISKSDIAGKISWDISEKNCGEIPLYNFWIIF